MLKIYALLIVVGLVGGVVYAGKYYHDTTQAQITTLTENNTKLEGAVETAEAATESLKQDYAKIAKELGLTTKQAEQLKAIQEKQRKENKVINEKMTPLKTQMNALREQKKALHEINKKEIESLLTPEQLIKVNELKERRKEKRRK